MAVLSYGSVILWLYYGMVFYFMVEIQNDGAILGWCYRMAVLFYGYAVVWLCYRVVVLSMVEQSHSRARFRLSWHGRVIYGCGFAWSCYFMVMLSYDGGAILRLCYRMLVPFYGYAVLWLYYRMVVLFMVALWHGHTSYGLLSHGRAIYGCAVARPCYFMVVLAYDSDILCLYYRGILLFYGDAIVW